MNAIALLLGLLGLAYLGSVVMSGRTIRGYGLPSGSEYLIVGLVLGPQVLGVIDRSTLQAFEPIVIVGLGWLAAIVGVDYGAVVGREVSLRGLVIGVALASASAVAVALVAYFFGARYLGVSGRELLLIAAGAAAVACETTRHAVRWVAERHGARGPVSDLVADIADADDLVPLLVLAALVPFGAAPTLSIAIPWWGWGLCTAALGALLGAMVAMLVRTDESSAWIWLLGAALLAVGAAWRLGLSVLSALFFMGGSLAALSRHRRRLRDLLNDTEHAVLLPILLLAGATVDFRAAPAVVPLVIVAVSTRFVVKFAVGTVAAAAVRVPRGSRALLALGLLPSGGLTISVGLFFALRFGGMIGDSVLAIAVAATLAGEVIGPVSLRRALAQAGEIAPVQEVSPIVQGADG